VKMIAYVQSKSETANNCVNSDCPTRRSLMVALGWAAGYAGR